MKKGRIVCILFMWTAIGGFIGRAVHVYFFYKKNPDRLELLSAPWYTELLIPLMIMIAVVGIMIVIRVILKKKDNTQ